MKSVNLIYLKDSDILAYITSKPQYNYSLSTFDYTTNTLLLYNPLEKTLTLFDCELELQKVKRKVKLLDIPKSPKQHKMSKSKHFSHKESLIMSSGHKKLSLIANPEEFLKNEEVSVFPMPDCLMNYKTMLGYLKHSLKQNKKDTISERLNTLFNPIFKEKFMKNSLIFCKKQNETEEKVTCDLCSYVNKSQLFYFIGTDQGNVYIFPFLFHYSVNFYPFFVYKNNEKPSESIKNLYVEKNCLFIEQGDCNLLTIELDFENQSEEIRLFFTKPNLPKECEDAFAGGMQAIIINKWLKSNIMLDSSIKSYFRLKTLRFLDENGQLFDQNEPKYSFFKTNIMPLGLILHSNNVAIYSMQTHKIEFDLKGNNSTILSVFLHPYLDEILTFNSKGYLYIYNIPTGVLDRIVSIENYSHLFNFNRYLNENYAKYNMHSFRKFMESEEFQTSKQHFLIDYTLRLENCLLDYSVGKEWMPKKEIPSKIISSNILNSAPIIELAGAESINPLTISSISNISNISNIANNNTGIKGNTVNIDEGMSMINYEKKKNECSNLIVYERSGAFLQIAKKAEKENAKKISNIIMGRKSIVKSHNKDQGICVMALDSLDSWNNESNSMKKTNDLGYVIFIDGKLNVRNLKLFHEIDQKKIVNSPLYLSYISMIFPWGIDKEYDNKILSKLQNKIPVFQTQSGVQGIGESFTFIMNSKDKWAMSEYYSTLHAISILYFVTSFEEKELKSFTNYILQIIESFSKKKKIHEKTNPCINLALICKFFLDIDGDLMTAAYNLLISSLKNKDIDLNFVMNNSLELYRLNTDNKFRLENFSYSQVIWILMIGYTSVFNNEKSRSMAEICVKDIIALTKYL